MDLIDRDRLADAVAYAGDWLAYRRRALRIPGLQVAIGHGDEVLLSQAYGLADVERGVALTPSHRLRVASHSKMFTATALLLLRSRGVLALDDSLGRWLDWIASVAPDLEGVTLRELLSHGGGVVRDGPANDFWQVLESFPDEAAFRELLGASAAIYPANVRFKYSNFGYTLLGLVVGHASGMPYNRFVEEAIVEPLGLAATGPEPAGDDWSLLARGYSADGYGRERFPLAHADTHAMSSATGFYSTALDLVRFCRAHFLGNPELLGDADKREMQHEQWHLPGEDRGYALGLVAYELDGRRLVGHTGGFPGFSSSTMFDPRQQLAVSVLTNAGSAPASELAIGVVRLINRAQRAPAGASAEARTDLDRFTGRFFSLGSQLDIVRFGGELLAIGPEGADPMEGQTALGRVEDRVLRITRAQGFASPGEEVHYEFDAGGRAIQVRWAGGTYLPEPEFDRRLEELRRAGREAT